MSVAPINIFESIFFKQIHFYQKCVGSDALTENFKPHEWTAFFMFLDISFVLCNCYTVVAYDTVTRLKCMAIIGLGFQGFAKFPTIIVYAKEIYDKVAFLRRIYERNSSAAAKAHAILLRCAHVMNAVMRIGSVIIISGSLLFVPENLLESMQAGQRMPMLNTMVPGMPIDGAGHLRNYFAVYAYHAILVFMGGFGTCAVDMLLVMLVMHMIPLSEIFEQQLAALNAVLRRRTGRRGRSFRCYFRNILLMHKEISGYLDTLADMYFFVFFVEINTDALSLVVLIVCFIQIQWICIYPLFALFMLKLFAYCVVGTIAELSTDRMYAALMACDWYELPLVEKREFMLMVLSAQRPAVLMAGTVPLNLDTFVNMLKTVYSVGMLLIESMEK